MSVLDVALKEIDEIWRPEFRFGVVTAPLMQPGRGHTSRGQNKKGWRLASEKEQDQLRGLVGDILRGLETGALDLENARRAVAEAGYSQFVQIIDSKEQMVQAFAETLREGCNVWADCGTDHVLDLECWYDSSHSRIV